MQSPTLCLNLHTFFVGGRTIKIKDAEGHSFRSICQACSALNGSPLRKKNGSKSSPKNNAKSFKDGKQKPAAGLKSKESGTGQKLLKEL